MVQTGAYRPTLEAVHLASAMARVQQATLVLVEMVAVSQPAWLGTELGEIGRTERTRREMESYRTVAEEYEVPAVVQPFQYITLLGAISDAADYVDARWVFAVLPKSAIPLWHRFQVWLLRQRLSNQGRQLVLPEEERAAIAERAERKVLFTIAKGSPVSLQPPPKMLQIIRRERLTGGKGRE
jgi:hypothetical protein